MSAGRKSTRVTLSRRAERVDARELGAFEVYATRWVEVRPLPGRLIQASGGQMAVDAVLLVIGRDPDTDAVKAGDLVQAITGPARAWTVKGVQLDMPRAGELELICDTESQSGG